MASRSISPGGALLRASRVFSMPPPLPRPSPDLSSTAIFQSDTATLPHPIHLSISTPQSSLARGDWGFKRPLPLRATTKTSTPIIRVESIDTFEHITEFGSAADHSLTLHKWQELGMPITTPPVGKPSTTKYSGLIEEEAINTSVFENSLDSTVVTERGLLDKDDTRWKFKGPWLAGVNQGEFNSYIDSQVQGRKQEFRQFLRTACAEDITRRLRRQATEQDGEIPATVRAIDVTEEQLDNYIRTLRSDITSLYGLIRKFLDLPPAPNVKVDSQIKSWFQNTEHIPMTIGKEDFSHSNSPYADSGPPKTHPSAGLGYARSSAYLVNHPVHGPQKNKTLVPARIVMPRNAPGGNFSPVLGVAGFVVQVPKEPSFNTRHETRNYNKINQRNSTGPQVPGLINVELDKVGGSKTWVLPKSAMVDSKGRVMLTVEGAHPDAVAVKENKTHELPQRFDLESLTPQRSVAPRRPKSMQETLSYGFGLGSVDL